MVGGEGVGAGVHLMWRALPTWTEITMHGTPCPDYLGSAFAFGGVVVGPALAVWAWACVVCPASDVGVLFAPCAVAEFAAPGFDARPQRHGHLVVGLGRRYSSGLRSFVAVLAARRPG